MHDKTQLTRDRVKRVLTERVWPAIYTDSRPFAIESAQVDGEPIAVKEGFALPFQPTTVGQMWGPAWGTTWFRLRGDVPAEWAGKQVEAVVDLGFNPYKTGFQAEGLAYRPDGSVIKAINPRNHYIPVADPAKGGEHVEFYIEAASNPDVAGPHDTFTPTMEGDILTSSPDPLYQTRRIDLAVLDQEVYDLALDLQVLYELQDQLPEGPRRDRILAAMDKALDKLDLQNIAGTAPTARAELQDVMAAPANASAHQVSAIGHAHIDSAWLWPLRETERKVARTTASMTDLIDRTDDFKYGMSSAQQYQWMKENRPELFERIREAVKKGRFVPLGGMWVESDTVMPSGESLSRQLLQGQRFFEKEFGQRSNGVWLPDSFGYSPNLPQLINRAGLDWFLTQKISWNQTNEFPHHTFWWEGIDGSRVPTHFPPVDTYNSELSGAEMAKAEREFHDSRIASGSIAPTGWGNGGGGTTREMVNKQKRLANLEGSPKVIWEHPDAFFARTRSELEAAERAAAVWVGELYLELHRATLTSQHKTKQGNRRNEHLLVEAEAWAATAALTAGLPYPYEEFDRLWQRVLLLQFHDILPGTSIAWVHREAVQAHAEVTAAAEAIIERSLKALAGDGAKTLFANGAMATREGVAPLSVSVATKPQGTATVTAKDGGWVLRNDLVTVVINARGHITSAVDNATGHEMIAPGKEALVLQMHQDFPNKWDAWDIDEFYRNSMQTIDNVDSINASMNDGVATVVVDRTFGNSKVHQVLTLAPESRVLEVNQTTDWHEVEKILKVAFPLNVQTDSTLAETQYGFVKRSTYNNTSWDAAKFETSMHRYVLAGDPGSGAALINDSIYAYDVSRDAENGAQDGSPQVSTTVRLSLLRAPKFPDPFTDQGEQTMRYGLVIDADIPNTTTAAMVLGAPRRQITGAHDVAPLVTVSGDGVVLAALKLAEDRSGDVIVRVYEAWGGRTSGSVKLGFPVKSAATASLIEDRLDDVAVTDGGIDFTLASFEVRTFRVTPA